MTIKTAPSYDNTLTNAPPKWIGFLDLALLTVAVLMFLSDATVLFFHLIYVLLTFGAFYWEFRAFTLRASLWVTVSTAEVVIAVLTGKTQAEELIEIPLMTVILALVFAIARQRANTAQQLYIRAKALEVAANGIVICNSQGRIEWANPAFARMSGYMFGETVGQNLWQFGVTEQDDSLQQAIWATVHSGRVWHGEIARRRKDGSRYFEEQTITPISDQQGVFFYCVAIKQDITERKKAEEALREANTQLTRGLVDMEQRAQEISLLNEMGGLLQSCTAVEEAYAVIANFAQLLFINEAGALYLLNASRNLVEAVSAWGFPTEEAAKPTFEPDDCWALRRGQAHQLDETHASLPCNHLDNLSPATSLCIPLIAQGEVLGILHLQSAGRSSEPAVAGDGLTDGKQRLAQVLADSIALVLANLKLRETLRHQSIRDPLTGLFNRRYMEETLDREMSRASRHQHPLGVIMLDVDHFKNFNDTFGHHGGDTLLAELGKFLRTHIRGADIACRYGGEEFALILPEASLDITYQRAEQIRQGVKDLRVQHRGQPLGAISVSSGVAMFPEHGATSEAVLRLADAALYRAKREGRDRSVIAQ